MLIQIAKIIGGTVINSSKGSDIIWVVNKKQEVERIIQIFDIYPPLSSKMICQLEFIKRCLTETSVNTYLFNRNCKYNNQLTIIKSNINFNMPSYFREWLSGFIEAKGYFSILKHNNCYFSIRQNDDIYLINAIKEYFEVTNKVKNTGCKNKIYFFEVYKKEVLLKIINHCINYPLLGEKLESLNTLNQKLI
jgi:hypothetical protein